MGSVGTFHQGDVRTGLLLCRGHSGCCVGNRLEESTEVIPGGEEGALVMAAAAELATLRDA